MFLGIFLFPKKTRHSKFLMDTTNIYKLLGWKIVPQPTIEHWHQRAIIRPTSARLRKNAAPIEGALSGGKAQVFAWLTRHAWKKTQLLDLCVSNLKVLCIVRPGVNHQSVAFKIKKFLIRRSDTTLCSNFHYDFALADPPKEQCNFLKIVKTTVTSLHASIQLRETLQQFCCQGCCRPCGLHCDLHLQGLYVCHQWRHPGHSQSWSNIHEGEVGWHIYIYIMYIYICIS